MSSASWGEGRTLIHLPPYEDGQEACTAELPDGSDDCSLATRTPTSPPSVARPTWTWCRASVWAG